MREHAGSDYRQAGLESGRRGVATIDGALALRQHGWSPAVLRQVPGNLPARLRPHLDGGRKVADDHEDVLPSAAPRLTARDRSAGFLSTGLREKAASSKPGARAGLGSHRMTNEARFIHPV